MWWWRGIVIPLCANHNTGMLQGFVKRRHMLYLEDLSVGQRYETAECNVSEADIKAFALQFDPQPFHVDEEAAKHSFFGELVASGWHVAAISMRLVVQGGPKFAAGIVGLGGELKWRKPTRPGDTLRVVCEIVEITESQSSPGRGTVTVVNETRNQRDEVVQWLRCALIVPKRTPPAAATHPR
jgi:acyl dehydratase